MSEETAAKAAAESQAEYVTRILRDRLVLLEIEPGAPLYDEALGTELGTGRTPVREAIKRLEAERLVTIYPRRGTFASPVNLTDLAEVSEIRAELEPLAASRAATHASADDRAHMQALIDGFSTLAAEESVTAHLRHDLAVHRSIYAANGNEHLSEVLTRYGNLSTRIWVVMAGRLANVSAHIGEHVELLASIIAGDPARAAERARHHVTSFEEMVRAAL